MSIREKLQSERGCELLGVLMLALTVLLFLTLVTDEYRGDVRRPLDGLAEVGNLLGRPGAVLAGILYILLGHASHVLYVLTCMWGLMLFRHRPMDRLSLRALGAVLLAASIAGLLDVDASPLSSAGMPGGAVGAFAGNLLGPAFGRIGSNVITVTLAIIGILLATEFLFVRALAGLRGLAVLILRAHLTLDPASRAKWSDHREQVNERREAARERAEFEAPPSGQSGPRVSFGAEADEPEPEEAQRVRRRLSAYRVARAIWRGGRERAHAGSRALEFARTKCASVGSLWCHHREGAHQPKPDFRERARELLGPDLLEADSAEAGGISGMATFQPAASAAVQGDIPFGPVPRISGTNVAVAFETVPEMQPAFVAPPVSAKPVFEIIPDIMFGPEPEDEEEPLAEQPDEDEAAPTLRVAPAQPTTPVMPQRKSAVLDELPPDYVYPRRYTAPSLNLLKYAPPTIVASDLTEKLRRMSVQLEQTLETFGVQARVTDVVRGPTITRFELEPAPGIKVSRFLSLVDDLALALKAHGVRVEAPIPGKGRVGIELPNTEREPVVLRELLESTRFGHDNASLSLALGKDIAGQVIVTDLTRMPHLLVAGATGSGKTVCVKSILASMLFAKTPDELQLMLIDPKMVELSIFNDIPHLITPVVTDPKKASLSLNWLITEMDERYRLFAHLRTRNIEVYNESVENGEIVMPDAPGAQKSVNIVRKLPYIVCVIDELADLMMLARSEVENSIARLAQLARAVGIHLIIATQRPSVDVLTGVIKANFPARVSFQVSSRVDSRCILDEIGAERLIGMGDMLYLPAGQSKPTRIQGAFVSDEEMETLIAYLKTQAPPQYRDEIERFGKAADSLEELAEEDDELFDDAVRVVLETGQASISMVQRRLRVGYTRAARLIDMMEVKGIVGPHIGSKARDILVDIASAESAL